MDIEEHFESSVQAASRNSIFRVNQSTKRFFERNKKTRKNVILSAFVHQAVFLFLSLLICGYLIQNDNLLIILFEEKLLANLISSYCVFSIFCLFMTRELR